MNVKKKMTRVDHKSDNWDEEDSAGGDRRFGNHMSLGFFPNRRNEWLEYRKPINITCDDCQFRGVLPPVPSLIQIHLPRL